MIAQHRVLNCFKSLLYVAFRERAGRTITFYKINNLDIFWRIFGVMPDLSTGLETIFVSSENATKSFYNKLRHARN